MADLDHYSISAVRDRTHGELGQQPTRLQLHDSLATTTCSPTPKAVDVQTLVPQQNPEARARGDGKGTLLSMGSLSPEFPHKPSEYSTGDSHPEFSQPADIQPTDGEDNVIPLQKLHWEHHGPWSWASVCSPPGVRWVCDRIHSNDFSDIANDLTRSWSRRLKVKRNEAIGSKSVEISEHTAGKYVAGKWSKASICSANFWEVDGHAIKHILSSPTKLFLASYTAKHSRINCRRIFVHACLIKKKKKMPSSTH